MLFYCSISTISHPIPFHPILPIPIFLDIQASHVKNKVDKKEAQNMEDKEKSKIAAAGNEFVLQDGKGTVELPTGPLEIWGHWDIAGGSPDRVVVLLGGLNSKPASLQGLIDALAEKGGPCLPLLRCCLLCPAHWSQVETPQARKAVCRK